MVFQADLSNPQLVADFGVETLIERSSTGGMTQSNLQLRLIL